MTRRLPTPVVGRVAAILSVAALVVSGCGSQATPSAGVPTGAAGGGPGASAVSVPPPAAVGVAASASPSGAAPASAAQTNPGVTATLLHTHLPSPLSRAVVGALGGAVLVIGGLGPKGTTGAILRIDPASGTVTRAGRLAAAVHDASGAPLNGSWLVMGGGRTVAVASIQQVSASGSTAAAALVGSLPAARADGAAVAVGGRILVVGGGRGGVPDGTVLATRDGVHFSRLATLAVPVRYGAVAAFGGAVYVFGGSTTRGDTDAVQRIDPVTGAVRVVGHLPRPVSEATAFVLGGRILVAGGMRAGRPTAAILAFSAATGHASAVGRLPEAVADAGVALIGTTAYLVGGETGTVYLASVIAIRQE